MDENFPQLLEEYLKKKGEVYKVGDVVRGIIVHWDSDFFYIDLGGKAEALLPKKEASLFFGEDLALGQEVEAMIVKRHPLGRYLLSCRALHQRRAQHELNQLFAQNLPFMVNVLSAVKGGYRVSFKGLIEGFLPSSQAVKVPELVGKSIYVLPLERSENSFVVSHKAYLDRERELKKKSLIDGINQGKTLKGRIKAVVKGGFLVDFEGVLTGYLSFSELSYQRLPKPEEYLQVGDEVEVKVKHFDPDSQQLKVSLKALRQDPWEDVPNKYSVDQRYSGTVISVKPFGAFVELEPGVEGLIPASEISWQKGVKPSEVLEIGDRVEVVIIEIKPEARRLLLSLKRLEEDPWESFAKQHKVGDLILGRIYDTTSFGLFVEIIPGVVGFVHVLEVSWRSNPNLPEEFPVGMEVKAKIIEFSPKERKLKLSLKALQPDPWEIAEKSYQVGSNVSGLVKRYLPGKGYKVELSPEIQAFLPMEEIPEEAKLKEGEEISAKVIFFEKEKRRITLSLRALQEEEERKVIQEYLQAHSTRKRASLAKILKSQFEKDQR